MNRANSSAEPSQKPESPASPAQKFTLILSIIIFVMSVAGSVYWRKYQTLQVPDYKTLGLTLQVLSFSPASHASRKDPVTITFNDSVNLDRFIHAFSISPSITGDFAYGSSDKQIIFTPKTPYESGFQYVVHVSDALVSKNGRKMYQPYNGSFSTSVADNQVQYIKDDMTGIVMGFAAQKPVEFTIRKGGNVGQIVTAVYKTNEKTLLKFLTYTKSKPAYAGPNDDYTVDTPMNDEVDVQSSTAVRTFTTDVAEDTVSLPLAPGMYYAQSTDISKKTVGQAFLLVNAHGLLVRQDDRKAYLTAFDLLSNTATHDTIDVAFINLENTPTVLSQRSLTGVQDFDTPFKTRVDLIMGIDGDERIFIPLRVPNSQADIRVYADLDASVKMFLYTDRPIYKPGDIIHFRGLIRQDGDALYSVPTSAKSVKVWLDQSQYSPADTTVQTDAHGNFHGDVKIPETITIQEYGNSLSAKIEPIGANPYGQAYAQISIAKYIKPDFDLKAEAGKPDYTGREPVSFSVKGTFFNGKPVTNTDISYTLYSQSYYETEKAVYNTNFNLNAQGGMCGGGGFDEEWYGDQLQKQTATLGSDGTATVTYTIPEDKLITSQKLTLVAKKKDQAGNEIVSAVSTVVHAAAYNIFFIPSAVNYSSGDEIIAPFYAETRDGAKITNHSFTGSLVRRDYSGSTTKEISLATSAVTSDDQGRGIIKLSAPTESGIGNYFVLVTTTDDSGNAVRSEKSVYITTKTAQYNQRYNWFNSINQTYLKITSSKNSFVVGDTINLSVVSPKPLDVLMTMERGRVYGPKIIHLNEGTTDVNIQVDSELSPSATVVFSFFADGLYYTEGLALNVPAMHKLLSMEISSDKQTYRPLESATLTITTRDPNANPMPAQFSLSIVDRAIYALKKSATPPIHSSFYYFRPRSTNASSSLTFIGFWGGGGGGGGGGASSDGKLVDTLYWNPEMETNQSGAATVVIPLGATQTTWRAQVYGSTDQGMVGQADHDFIVTQ